MTRLVQAELLKLRTTRTIRALLALTAAGTAALVAVVLLLAGQPGQPALGPDALRQLVLVPAQPLTLAALVLGILHQPGLERWLPMGAAPALTRPGDVHLPIWAGALVLAAYGLVLALLGGRLVARRDLT
jgi:hypothetical protein